MHVEDDSAPVSTRSPRRRPRARVRVEWLGLIPAIFLLAFFVVPIVYMVYLSLFSAQGFSVGEYTEAFGVGANRRGLVASLKVCVYATLITALLGAVLLAALELWPSWGRRLVLGALLLPFVASGELVRIVAWFVLLAPDGLASRLLAFLGFIEKGSSLIPSTAAVVLALVHILLPFYVFTVYAATRRIDKRVVRAGVSLGASPLQAVLTAYVPLAVPAMTAGSLIVFVIALGYYATPAALGGSDTVVLPILIQNQVQQVGDWPQAAALGTILLLLALAVLLVLFRWAGLDVLYTSVAAPKAKRKRTSRFLHAWLHLVFATSGRRPDRPRRPRYRGAAVIGHVVLGVSASAVLCYLAAPLVVVLGASVNRSSLIGFPPKQLSLHWYEQFGSEGQWMPAFTNSMIIGIACAAVSVLLGLCCALVLNRGTQRMRTPLLILVILPMVTPWVVVALGMFFEANKLGTAYTLAGIVLGHVVLALPFTVIVIASALSGFDWNLDRAAQSSGATLQMRLRHVLLPLLRPALISALLFAFIMSLSEVVFALLMSSVRMTTLPVVMWQGLTYSVTPVVAAAGGVLTVVCLVTLGFDAGFRTLSRFITARRR